MAKPQVRSARLIPSIAFSGPPPAATSSKWLSWQCISPRVDRNQVRESSQILTEEPEYGRQLARYNRTNSVMQLTYF